MDKLLSIKLFEIKGFRGECNVKAKIDDGVLILVGDNGSGKTTFLRTMFFFLAGKWDSLSKINFKSISIKLGDFTFEITKEEVDLLAEFNRIEGHIRGDYLHQYELDLFNPKDRIEYADFLYMRRRRWEIMNGASKKQAKKVKELESSFNLLRDKIDAQILYLPTYRRIERELNSIFEDKEIKSISSTDQKNKTTSPVYVELVEFGMRDVKSAVEKNLAALKEFARKSATALNLGYLGDIVNRGYEKEIKDFSEVNKETINSVLNRVDDSVLTQEHKNYISELISSQKDNEPKSEHIKIIRHYFSKLLAFQQDLSEKEKSIIDFCVICSKYMTGKKFEYDNSKFQFSANNKDKPRPDGIDLSDLSSGEKQIASLFSHLYLSNNKRYLVLIDEPELSLSVPWQKEFLVDIVNSGLCAGLVAVTHSPFIYSNELKKYATSMGELIS